MNYVEQIIPLVTQAAGDDAFSLPIDTAHGPAALISAMVRLTAVAGTPTAVTMDVDITDGSVTRAAIAAQSIGTAAGQTRLAPTDAVKEAGDHIADQEDPNGSSPAYWRADVDFNFTGGTSPTVTGWAVLRWAV